MMVRRIVAALLANVFLFTTAVQTLTAGAETNKSDAENISLSNDEINIESTNSFGSILAKEISAEQEEQLANNGCNVFSIEMDGTQANVKFQTADDCTLVVGVYDESGERLLATGSAEVLHDQTEAAVSIEIDDMPEYFYLKGYLIESADLAPMCTVYENPNYTQKMQEFFSKTVEDFDAERVLNFDDDATTNFAVYEENTIIIPQNDDGYNVVASADDAACVYVIENVDDSFLSLEAGDIFAYQYSENDLLITKIAEIEVDDTTVTITGDETSMDEVFEHVRIEAEQGMEDAEITPAEGAVVVDENGDEIESPQFFENSNRAMLAESSLKKAGASATETAKVSLKKEFETEIKGETNNHNQTVSSLQGSVKVSASFALSASLSYKLYLFSEHNYVELQLSYSSAITFSATGAAQLTVPIGTVGFAPVAGCIVEITPSFIVKLSGELSASGTWTGSVGLRADADSGKLENISKAPKFTLSAKAEGTFYFGLDLMPKISLINEKILSMSMTGNVGVEIVAKMNGSLDSNMNTDVTKMDKMHACNACIDGDLNFKYSLSFKLGLFKDKFSAELKLLDKTKKIGNFYYSFDYNELEFEECPHQLYRVELQCVNLQKNPIEGVSMKFTSEDTVMTADNVLWGTPLEGELLSNENGKAAVYIGKGTTTIETKKERFVDSKSNVTLTVDKNGDLKINNTKTNQHQIVIAPVAHTVSVHVETEEGEPLDLAKISIAGNGDTKYTNASGDAELKLSNGTYELTISDTGYQAVTETLTIYDEGQSLSFQLVPVPYVSVCVTDQYGDPVNGAKLNFTNTQTGENVLLITSTTDENGLYSYSFDVGKYEFTATKKGYDDYSGSFTVSKGGTEVEVEMHCNLRKATIIVKDGSEKPLSGVSIKSYYDNTSYVTDDNGTVIIKLPVGETELRLIKDGYYTSKSFLTVNEGEDSTATFQLEYASTDTSESDITYTPSPDGVVIISGTGNIRFGTGVVLEATLKKLDIPLKKVIIKDTISGIDDLAFSYCTNLTEIIIPDSVTSIGNSAFFNCNSLESVYISDIAAWCNIEFYDSLSNPLCFADNLYLNDELVTNVVVPEKVTSIGKYAFKGYDSLTEIIIPNSVTSIGDNAFSSCTNLTEITIPNSVTSIGTAAFSGCTSLKEIIIPNSVTSIADMAFSGCTNLTKITIPDSVTSIGDHAFSSCTNLTEIIIPDSVTSIGDYAFSSCTNLTKITIPDNVTSIGDSAFSSCTNLTEIKIPDSVTSVGDNAFSGCTSLTEIIIPDSVTSMGDSAFSGCTIKTLIVGNDSKSITHEMTKGLEDQIEKVIIPSSVTSVRYNAFYGCKKLTEITIPDSVTSIGDSAFSGCTIKTLIVGNDSKSITYEMTNGLESQIEKVIIPSSVTSIGDSAFSGCINLTEITLPDNVTSIGNKAFSGCINLTEIKIPDSVTSVGNNAFSGCTKLTEIIIPDSVTSLSNSAFSGCTIKKLIVGNNSKSITYNMTNGLEDQIEKVIIPSSVTSIGDSAFSSCINLTEITLPDSVTSIGNKAFSGCTILSEIIIPDSVTSVGDNAFSGCTKLTEITIPDSVTSIKVSAFSGCTGLTKILIPNSVTSISNNAFEDCSSLTSITIPDSVTNIGTNAFEGCSLLTSITIPDNVKRIGDSAFEGCTGLKTIKIPDSVILIGKRTFFGCEELISITIPDSVKSIGDSAFEGCIGLTTVKIPDSVVLIGKRTFWGCEKLISISIPDSVKSIGESAFERCTGLTSIIIPNAVIAIEKGTFWGCEKLVTITIPDSVKSIGEKAFYVCDLLSEVYYTGTKEQWNALSIASKNDQLDSAIIYYNYMLENEKTSSYTMKKTSSVQKLNDETTPTVLMGDVNFDGVITKEDVVFVEEHWGHISTGGSGLLTEEQIKAADMNDDGQIDSEDIEIIRQNITTDTTTSTTTTTKKFTTSTTSKPKKITTSTITRSTSTATNTTSTTHFTSTTKVITSTTNKETTTQPIVTTVITTIKTVIFTDLEPDRIYNFYSVKSRETDDILSADNLIYVSQGMADENGYLDFEYSLDANTEEIVEFVVGMIYCIEYADVAIKDMEYTGSELTPEIAITYDGKTLEGDKDYALSGIMNASKPGLYEVKVSGIGDYYGEKYVDYAINCEHKYADGICATCGTQCVHTYENGLCSMCGDTLPITATTSITVSTTTTKTSTKTTTTSTITSTTTTTTSTTTSKTTTTATTTASTTTSTITTTTTTLTTTNATTSTTVTSTTNITTTTTPPPTTTEPAYLLGDVNEDGSVDSSDASIVLAEYALLQTGKEPILTKKQSLAADVNKDEAIDSSDASNILGYYAYISTGGILKPEKYFNV